ncbi:MAG: hypothetical protein NTW21_33030, partial [Verrucomicrobia bacterium]|nr:hypothetical protein [Verrucomicrobiota bacterium]
AGIGMKHVIATQALAGGGGTHRRTQNALPTTRFQPPFRKKILPATLCEEDREEDAGRRVLLEAFEEDLTQAPSDVQVAHFIGFP